MATLHPPADEIARFSTPLNKGEKRILDLLDGCLDRDWHLFVQPQLPGNHPDFVLVNRRCGATAVEVKDWGPGLRRIVNGRLMGTGEDGSSYVEPEDPLAQTHRYREAVVDLMVPPGSDGDIRRVRGVAVAPRIATADWERLVCGTTSLPGKAAKYIAALGKEVFSSSLVRRNLILGPRGSGWPMEDEDFERLLDRLREPDAVADQRRPLVLSKAARKLVSNADRSVIRRARGPAGSGKTAGLAARAAVLAKQDKHVLVVTFNTTLAHYVQDLVRRHARDIGSDHRLVTCLHFHRFCADIAKRGGSGSSVPVESRDDDESEDLVQCAEALYVADQGRRLPRYDAVLVDEGQDFELRWWNLLRHHVRRGETSEMIMISDPTQDIYARRSWTDEDVMRDAGFHGSWTELTGCYRLPSDLVPIVSQFAERYIGPEALLPTEPTDGGTDAAAPTRRRWVDAVGASPAAVADLVADEVERIIDAPDGPHEADVVYLTNQHDLGSAIASSLERKGRRVEHIFAADQTGQKRRKRAARDHTGHRGERVRAGAASSSTWRCVHESVVTPPPCARRARRPRCR